MRQSIRQLQRAPGFFAVAALLIAVGVTAATLIFGLVDALLLRPLPVRDPRNLVQLFELQPKRPADPFFDYLFFKYLSRYSSTLEKAVGERDTVRALERSGHGERIHAGAVSDNFFSDLGVTPLLGRCLANGDSHVAVLSYGYWSSRFGRDPKVLGQVVQLTGHPYTIVGVAPREFSGTTVDSGPDLWTPYVNQLDFWRGPNPTLDHDVIEIVARLRPGLTVVQAQEETAALWERYMQEAPRSDPNHTRKLKTDRLEVRSIARGVSPIRDQSQTALVLLLGGTGLLLLMVCANVGGLLLSRATARERETAVRVALGAGRSQILRQWLMESLLLTALGGTAGILVAFASMPLLLRWMPPAHGTGVDPAEIRTLTLQLHPDFRVAAFSAAVCLLTTLLCAIAPAWQASSADINLALKNTGSDARSRRFQSILCGFQIALCTMLLVSAGLIIRSLDNLRASNGGFDRDHVAVFSVDPHVAGYDAAGAWSLEQRLMQSAKELPAVAGAALASRGLMRGIGLGISASFPGHRNDGIINTSINSVTPDYFQVMGIRLLEGRTFSAAETYDESKTQKAVVNAAFVRKFLNGPQPLGQKFSSGAQFSTKYEIIGVVSDTKYRSLREIPPPIVYTYDFGPKAYPEAFILHVSTHGDPRAVIERVRQLVRSIDPELPLYQVATLSEEIESSLWQERLVVALTSCFGAFALLLSAIGLYGILAYFIARRQRDIGVRMALGAKPSHIIRLVINQVSPSLALGMLAGLALSWTAGAWLRSLLYGIQPLDPLATSAALLLLLAMGAAGAAGPAFRAIRLDPSTTLRRD